MVSGSPAGVITDVNVGLNLTHTFDPDLVITLISPTGKRILLSANNGFKFPHRGQNYTNTIFDDQATTPITQGLAPFTGSFSPQAPLSDLIGDQPNGTWTLEINDTLAIDTGTLLDWSLQIQVGTVTTSIVTGVPMDQNANGIPGEAGLDSFAAPQSSSGIPFTTPFVRDTLPLIVPGPRVVSTQVVNATGSLGSEHNLVLNGTVGAFDVTFDRDMNPSTFTKDDVLRIEGPEGVVDPASYTVTSLDARTFRIGFALQQLSGTYQLTLGSDIRSAVGNYAVDTNQNAGMDALRGGSLADPTVQVTFASADVPKAVAAATTSGSTVTPTVVSSTIKIDDSFTIRDLNLQLNIQRADQTKPADISKLKVELVAPDGTTILLFANLKNTTGQAAFTDTILDDQADLSIDQGGPAFTSSFKPESFLGDLNGSNSLLGPNGTVPSGVYTLRITNSDSNAWTLNSWRLIFQKPVPGNGLGEPVADRITGNFRIFTMATDNSLSTSTWTAVGPASINNGGGAGRIGGLALDPSDPSGNTVYAGGASGGVWKTNNFLTTDPEGPNWIPLIDTVATFGMNIGGIAVFPRNNDPNQSIVFVATGEGDTGSRGVGFLRSMDGGATWDLLDSTDNTLPFSAPSGQTQRDHALVGNSSYQIVVDPRPTPTGQVIVYAAMSGGNGGIWRSSDTGNTWQKVLDGQATDVILDPTSGTVDAFTNPTGNLQRVFAGIRGSGVWQSTSEGVAGSFSLMAGGVGKPLRAGLRRRPDRPRAGLEPGAHAQRGQGPHRPGQAIPDRRPETGLHVPGLALCRGRHHQRSPRRRLPDQGLRPELDAVADSHAAAPRQQHRPAWSADERYHPGRLRSAREHPVCPGELRRRPGDRPDQSQHRLPGRHRRRQPVRPDPDRRDRRQRSARVLPQRRPPRGRGPAELCHGRRDHRAVESRGSSRQFPVRIRRADLGDDESLSQPRQPARGQRDGLRQQRGRLRQQRRRRPLDRVRRIPDRHRRPPHVHAGRSADGHGPAGGRRTIRASPRRSTTTARS